MTQETKNGLDARLDSARSRMRQTLPKAVKEAAVTAAVVAGSTVTQAHAGQQITADSPIPHAAQQVHQPDDTPAIARLRDSMIEVGKRHYNELNNEPNLLYGNEDGKDTPSSVTFKTPETPKMPTKIPSKDDEVRMRSYLKTMFNKTQEALGDDKPIFANVSLPPAPCDKAAAYLAREWVMASCRNQWENIPKYRPLRDKIKKGENRKYSPGDHFAAHWQLFLDRGVLFRPVLNQYDSEFSADLATYISRQKKKDPNKYLNLPTRSDYVDWLAGHSDSLMGDEAVMVASALVKRETRM